MKEDEFRQIDIGNFDPVKIDCSDKIIKSALFNEITKNWELHYSSGPLPFAPSGNYSIYLNKKLEKLCIVLDDDNGKECLSLTFFFANLNNKKSILQVYEHLYEWLGLEYEQEKKRWFKNFMKKLEFFFV
jgi:hypothetical protein